MDQDGQRGTPTLSVDAESDLLAHFCRVTDACCPKCRYSLKDAATARCPECGSILHLRLATDETHGTAPLVLVLAFLAFYGAIDLVGFMYMTWTMFTPVADMARELEQPQPSFATFLLQSTAGVATRLLLGGVTLVTFLSGALAFIVFFRPVVLLHRRLRRVISAWVVAALAGVCLIELLNWL